MVGMVIRRGRLTCHLFAFLATLFCVMSVTCPAEAFAVTIVKDGVDSAGYSDIQIDHDKFNRNNVVITMPSGDSRWKVQTHTGNTDVNGNIVGPCQTIEFQPPGNVSVGDNINPGTLTLRFPKAAQHEDGTMLDVLLDVTPHYHMTSRWSDRTGGVVHSPRIGVVRLFDDAVELVTYFMGSGQKDGSDYTGVQDWDLTKDDEENLVIPSVEHDVRVRFVKVGTTEVKSGDYVFSAFDIDQGDYPGGRYGAGEGRTYGGAYDEGIKVERGMSPTLHADENTMLVLRGNTVRGVEPAAQDEEWKERFASLCESDFRFSWYGTWCGTILLGGPFYEFGTVRVQKNVTGAGASTSKAFTFTAKFTGKNSPDDKRFTLTDGKMRRFFNVPVGTKVTISEVDDADYTKSCNPSSWTHTVSQADGVYTFVVTNTHKTGSMAVKKVLDGPSTNEDFNFVVTFSGDGAPAEKRFTLKAGASRRIDDIPVGVKAKVTETGAESYSKTYSPSSGEVTIAASNTQDNPVTVTVTNERKTGNFEVKKTVDYSGMGSLVYDRNRTFEVKVNLKTDTGVAYKGTYGGMTFDANGDCTLTLKHNQSVRATDVPVGYKWTVTEPNVPTGYTRTGIVNGTGSVVADGNTQVVVTNKQEYGDLEVQKVVDYSLMPADMVVDRDRTFDIRVTLKNGTTNVSGTYGDMTFTNGVCDLELKHGQSSRATMIPKGWSYTVEERNLPAGYKRTGLTNPSGPIVTGQVTKSVVTNQQQFGEFTVTKKVDYSLMGDMVVDRGRKFNVTVTLKDANDNPVSGRFGDMTFNAAGTYATTLGDGESRRATVVPAGYKYQVSETNVVEGYKVIMPATNPDTVGAGKRKTFVVTNQQRFGAFEVSKNVDYERMRGRIYDRDRTFKIRVRLYNASGAAASGTWGNMTFTSGVCNLELRHGEKRTATMVPDGYRWEVEEHDLAEGYELKGIDHAKESVTIGKTMQVVVRNEQQFGDFAVEKIVDRSLIKDKLLDKDRTFHFKVTLVKKDGTKVNGTYGDMKFTDGVCEFDLKDGERKDAKWVPEGWSWTTNETVPDGYDLLDIENQNGKVRAGETIVTRYTNIQQPGWAKVNKVTA